MQNYLQLGLSRVELQGATAFTSTIKIKAHVKF